VIERLSIMLDGRITTGTQSMRAIGGQWGENLRFLGIAEH
jgi:hypothetical protein